MKYKFAIIGARRKREGTGFFLIKFFLEYGCELVGILGTSKKSNKKTSELIKKKYNINVKTYLSFSNLLKYSNPNIIVISSPKETHYKFIIKSISNHKHVFCEKPLFWKKKEYNISYYIENIKYIKNLNKNNLIHISNQWPYTIDSFINIVRQKKTKFKINKYFEFMLTSKIKSKNNYIDNLIESLPHFISIIEKINGIGMFSTIKYKQLKSNNHSKLIVTSIFYNKYCKIKTKFILNYSNQYPRPAYISIDSNKVERVVDDQKNYNINFKFKNNYFPIEDPMLNSVSDFLNKLNKNSTFTNYNSLNFQFSSLLIFIKAYKQLRITNE